MTAHDHPEYVPGCYRCDLSRDEVTAADRPSVTDNARAAIMQGLYDAVTTIKETGGAVEIHGVRIEPCDTYGQTETTRALAGAAGRVETTTGAIARGEALAAGDPDWMNVTRWPRTEAEATTVILRLIEDNRRMRHGSLCPECNAKAWGERADFRRERDELAAKVAAVEALADEWDKSDDTHEWILAADLRAALTEQENNQ